MAEQVKAKILVVEDEDIARKNLEHILKREGYDVVSVDNGEKALRRLRSLDFDMVITDLKMEKVDGMEILEKSRKLQPYTEVVMITGYATVDTAVKAMKEGAYYYIAKPYKIDEVKNNADSNRPTSNHNILPDQPIKFKRWSINIFYKVDCEEKITSASHN